MFDKMWKRALLVTVAGLAIAAAVGGPIKAQSERVVVAPGGAGVPPADRQAALFLYDQYNNAGANSLTSQNFEAIYDAYDSFLADDFNKPGGQTWRITQIDVDGVYVGTGPAASFNVFLHRTVANLPKDPPVNTRLNQAYALVGASTFRITVNPPIQIPKVGLHLWIAVQANMNFVPGGQWFWTDRSVLSNTGSAWKNPGGGFGVGCLTWANMNGCLAQTDPDLMFTLYGAAI